MHRLILRYDLIREKCICFNEETQTKNYLEVFVMSKIFTWTFGFITGTVGGILLLAWTMAEDPDRFIANLEYNKTHR